GPGRQVLCGILGLGETTGRLDDDIDAELDPGKLRWVSLLEHADARAVDDNVVTVGDDLAVENAEHRIVLEQVRKGVVIGEVVYRDHLEVGAESSKRSVVRAADAAKPIDSDLYGHKSPLIF